MIPIDMNRLHLWMGITHPVFGPLNYAWYLSNVALAGQIGAGHAWYVTWLSMMADLDRRSDGAQGKS